MAEQEDIIYDREALLREINDLKQQLLWYKRTYEERSLLGILYERLFGKQGKRRPAMRPARLRTSARARILKPRQAALLPDRILCSIVNHNYSDNAQVLHDTLGTYFDTVLLDSGSDQPPPAATRLPNIYYSGLLNEAYSLARQHAYTHLLFVCSDVKIDKATAAHLFERLRSIGLKGVGIYSPASRGGGHFFCKKQTEGSLRPVPFVEGFIFLCDMEVLAQLCPVDTHQNLYGWGLDIAKGYFAREQNKLCLVDDSVEVEHAEGTGYSRETAELEMHSWVRSLPHKGMVPFFEEQLSMLRKQASKETDGSNEKNDQAVRS